MKNSGIEILRPENMLNSVVEETGLADFGQARSSKDYAQRFDAIAEEI